MARCGLAGKCFTVTDMSISRCFGKGKGLIILQRMRRRLRSFGQREIVERLPIGQARIAPPAGFALLDGKPIDSILWKELYPEFRRPEVMARIDA